MTHKRILIVEDDAIIGWHMEHSLMDLGYRVVGVVDNGEEAISTTLTMKPDLVLMDIGLKGEMDGVEVAANIHDQLNIPVVYLTAYTDSSVLERAKFTEPYGYLRKPFDDQALRATIEMALHKHALEQQLRESERRFRQLFTTIHEGFALFEIIQDPSGKPVDFRFLNINPAYEELTGVKAADVTGKTILSVWPEYDHKWIEACGKVAITGEPANFDDYDTILKRYFHIAVFSPSPGQFATLLTDTTATKSLEIDLRRSEKRLRLLTASAASFVFEIDRKGTIRFVNRSYAGCPPEEIVGTPLVEWYPENIRQQIHSILERVYSSGQGESTEYTLPGPNGAWCSYLAQFTPVLNIEGSDLIVLTATDITQQEQAEMALAEERALLVRRVEERTADLSVANAQLAAAARTKDEFLASMSHELRTPLTGILGLAEALQKNIYGETNDQMRSALTNIEESGHHLLALINDILDLSKIESGHLELEFRPASLETICNSAVRLVQPTVIKKKIELNLSYNPVLNRILADERRLKQILVNLLSNAAKFTPEGGQIGLITDLDEDEEVMRLVVWDTGIGIEKQDIQRLFRPFVQLDSSLSKPYPGTGLGLSLVMRLVELHGGGVHVESQPGCGSRFTVVLPWKTVEDKDLAAWALRSRSASSTQPLHSLAVIQGINSSGDPLARILRENQMEVHTWGQSENPLEFAASLQPELIFLDTLLPGMPSIYNNQTSSQQGWGNHFESQEQKENEWEATGTGWDLLHALKTDPRTRHIPVIIVSVLDERLRGISLGASDYLVSPYTSQQISEVLRKVFQGRGSSSNSPVNNAKPLTDTVILIAEDNDLTLNTISDFLTAQGGQVIQAHNGTEAIELFREGHPDLILMDIQMPVMDGLEAIRHIRTLESFPKVPIIALTALAMVGDRERCLQAGATEYLSKPVTLSQLVQTIQEMTTNGRS